MIGLLDYGGLDREDGGHGSIVLLHGLMGRGRTWKRQIPWLRRYGRVFTFDAAFHQGVTQGSHEPTADEISTERFVADVAEVITWIDRGPAVLVGHSMGGLHAWCTAAQFPELVAATVVEDMAPDFRGRTTGDWAPWFNSWPDRFADLDEAVAMFGEVAGRYFYEAFDDGRLHGRIPVWAAIAEEWGTREFWGQWDSVQAPTLLLEAEYSVTPPGQMAQMAQRGPHSHYLRVEGAGHLVHDDRPGVYRGAVEAFLAGLGSELR
ncbi:alpha/beta hydrolase [Gordonia sp. (in: high G+C Gram-positive bacteria)]|uniref:alpha/beta fold hydrolase n=1 Tax=Gordonia sp. (in: high G+C Gram-positive bacteria) TaxID=84139 RepID=UPI0016901B46|nr:alpha/beta hydrolase [Gordonia sp. (in: high G+C Gram-positive bacteria)]NLG48170.1 alpha/beta hydrolase [Gordonia sp. (in: high G+C Gram-positive bacteria)]